MSHPFSRVTARFYVRAIEKYAYQGATPANPAPGWAAPAPMSKVSLAVVSGGRAPENAQWASSTPSGEITMTVGNPQAAEWFEAMLGKDIAVTFEARDDVDAREADARLAAAHAFAPDDATLTAHMADG